jgi:hypothetical protein
VQRWCKPSAESLLFAEVQPIVAGEFFQIACKGTTFSGTTKIFRKNIFYFEDFS